MHQQPHQISGRWGPQNFRDDEQFERDSLYSPGNPDEAMEGIAPGNVPDNDEMLDTLMMTGVSLPEARARVCAMRSSRPAATFTEVYGGEAIAIVECANNARRDLNIVGLRALDLRTLKPDGQPRIFSLKSDRRLASELIDQDQPDWLIGSPPCTAFSIWNNTMK